MPKPLDNITQPLIKWFEANKRPLPWREDRDPYHVWISEIMLQQTRIEAVMRYYRRFMEALPDIESLSKVDDDKLMKLWEGLGYYSRARNLKRRLRPLRTNTMGFSRAATARSSRSPASANTPQARSPRSALTKR